LDTYTGQPDSNHSAADIDADGIWDNDIFRRKDAAYGHTITDVHIRHSCDVVDGERQTSQVVVAVPL
jgi:hypothetical protein